MVVGRTKEPLPDVQEEASAKADSSSEEEVKEKAKKARSEQEQDQDTQERFQGGRHGPPDARYCGSGGCRCVVVVVCESEWSDLNFLNI